MASSPDDRRDPEVPLDIERLVFFSDAVFAIAITLLVIELSVPADLTTDAELRAALAALGPNLFSFFLTFAVTALWWLSHHRLMRVLEHPHGALVVLNFVLLGAVAFLPFASGVLGHHGDLPTAVILYAATNVVASGSIVLMRLAARRLRLLRDGLDMAAFDRQTWYAFATGALFAISIPIAVVSPDAARLSWNLVLVVVLVRSWDQRRRTRLVAAAE